MTSLQKARAAVFVYFLLCGSAVTIWATHIPFVQKSLALSHTQIGFIILLMGAGALASMQVVGAMVDRFGSGRALVWISVTLGLALGLPGLAMNYLTLAIAIFVLGLNIGGIDIAMNAQALEVERAYGRPIFSSFHAMWSIGGVLGSLSAGAALSLQIAMPVTMGTWGLLTIATGLAFSKKLLTVTIDAAAESVAKSKGRPREFYYVLFIGLVSASAAIIEGIGIDWSALFTIEKFNSSVAVGGISIATFTAAMAIVRFIADKVVARYGRIFVIRNGALVASVGIALSIFTPNLPLSWIGWAIAGIGISAVVPQCMAFASDIGSLQNQGRNLAKVVGLTYAGVLGGPAVIGFIGNAIGLQGALVSGILLALFIAIGSILMQKGKAEYGQTI
jgi:MFS family permease